MLKILIGSPIRQQYKILKEFLISLKELDINDLDISYYFVDDNDDIQSSNLLKEFSSEIKQVLIKQGYNFEKTLEKVKYENHLWKKELIKKISNYKNDIITYARENDFDYLFFIDSDIILNPNTLKHLISRKKEIVSNIFWTHWEEGEPLLPQVWLQDESNFFIRDWDKEYKTYEVEQLSFDFVNKLKVPGIYEVGGLGACTLISKVALQKPISFDCIDNISFWGEDRHFSIRARVLGIKLYVDTVYPAYHIYRVEYLKGVKSYKEKGFEPNDFMYFPNVSVKIKSNILKSLELKFQNIIEKYKKYRKFKNRKKRIIKTERKITLSMIVKNEEKRYLGKMLEDCVQYIDEAVIIDDASTDNTILLCKKILESNNIKYKIIENKKSLFANEIKLRKLQWNEVVKTNPDWILFLDADEIFEKGFKNKVEYLIKNNDVDAYCFRLYDLWNQEYYRSDNMWYAHKTYRPFLIRYQPKFKYKFNKGKQHCGRMPKNVLILPYSNSELRLKHYGWVNEKDRKSKYDRYMRLDSKGKYGLIEQYKSIMDKDPNLIFFEESESNNES